MYQTIVSIAFYVFAAALIVSAIAMVSLRNVFHSAIALVAALSFVAAIFFLLGADFLGASQVLVYVGGIMIIMLFVIMLSAQPLDALQRQFNDQRFPGFFLAIVIAASLVITLKAFQDQPLHVGAIVPTSVSIGQLLLKDMLLPFEAVSLVLLAALVGAVLFASPEKKQKEE